MKDTKVIVHSETEPTFVFGEEGLADTFREFHSLKMRYDHAKKGAAFEFFWFGALSTFAITQYNPFPENHVTPFWANTLLICGVLFWGICLYGSIRSIVRYKYKYKGEDVDKFMTILKKQPWR